MSRLCSVQWVSHAFDLRSLFRQHREAAAPVSQGGSTYDASNGDPQDQSEPAGNNPLFNVMLTCYSLFERDSADQQADRSFLKKWNWSHLLLDEAHAVKNATAMRTKRLTRCAGRTSHRDKTSHSDRGNGWSAFEGNTFCTKTYNLV